METSEKVTQLLRKQVNALQEKVTELSGNLEKERTERVAILLKNAEISQSEEILKQELRHERDEMGELQEQIQLLQTELKDKTVNEKKLESELKQMKEIIQNQETQMKEVNELTMDLNEKNKVVFLDFLMKFCLCTILVLFLI